LGLYKSDHSIIGGLGVSGDTSCTDHIVAWKLRDSLQLDTVPGGVGPGGTDNIYFGAEDANGHFKSPAVLPAGALGGFAHPECLNLDKAAAESLRIAFPPVPNH
jgi:hypothetical protein